MTETKEIKQTLADLKPETRYIVRVRAINGFGVQSEWSEALSFVTGKDQTIPRPPSELAASFDEDDVLIKWIAADRNVNWTPIEDFSFYELTITPDVESPPSGHKVEIRDTTYVFFGKTALNVWGSIPTDLIIEVRTVDTSGNRSSPVTLAISQ